MIKPLLDKDLIDQALHDDLSSAVKRAAERGVHPIMMFATAASVAIGTAKSAGATLKEVWETVARCCEGLAKQ